MHPGAHRAHIFGRNLGAEKAIHNNGRRQGKEHNLPQGAGMLPLEQRAQQRNAQDVEAKATILN